MEGLAKPYGLYPMAPSRTTCVTVKVRTEFGAMYIQIDLTPEGHPCGGRIATPEKEPEAQITRLVETLSLGLNKALKILDCKEEGHAHEHIHR